MQRVYATMSVSTLVKLEGGAEKKVDIEMLKQMVPFTVCVSYLIWLELDWLHCGCQRSAFLLMLGTVIKTRILEIYAEVASLSVFTVSGQRPPR
jgi:hypothetical protein